MTRHPALESLRDQFRRLQIPSLTHQLTEWNQAQYDADGRALLAVLPSPNIACGATFLARTDRAGKELLTTRIGWLTVGSPTPLCWIGQYIGPFEALKRYAQVARFAGEALVELGITLPTPEYVRANVLKIVPDVERILPNPVTPFVHDLDAEAVNRWTFALHWLGWSGQRPLALARRHSLVSGTEIPYDVTENAETILHDCIIISQCDVVLSSIEMVDWLLDQVATEGDQDGESPTELPDLVTLDQAAASVGKSKKTLERHKKGTLPSPTVEGGGGRSALWEWNHMRPWLENEFHIRLPKKFPANRNR